MWIFILFLGLFFNIPKVQAKSYTISPVSITETVLKDGSMKVEEQRTFNFQGDYSFAYQYINKFGQRKEPYILTNFKICDELICYKQSSTDTNIPNTFFLKEESNRYYLKWFYSASNQSKNFKLSYDVANAITLHSDIAEIYWQSIGSDWEIDQSNINVKFILPQGIDGSQIQAWAHGPTNGTVSIPSASEVNLKVNYLPIKTFFEGRILVPKETFTNGVKGNLSKSEITREENKFIKDTIDEKKTSLIQIYIALGVGFGLIIWQLVMIIKSIRLFKKYGKEIPLPKINLSGRFWEPPSDIDPAQVEQLITGTKQVSPNAFTATILSLVVDRFYKISRSDEKEGFIFKKYQYFLVSVNENKKEPSSIQSVVIDLLKQIEDKNGEVKLSVISLWFRENVVESRLFFSKVLPKLVLDENLSEGYFDQESDKIKYFNFKSILPSIITILMFFVSLKINPLLSIVLFFNFNLGFFTLIILGILTAYKQKRTLKGAEETAKWIGFKKHLEEYNQTVKDPIDSVIIWEKYLVYGTVLGVSTKSLSQLPINFSSSDRVMVASFWGGNNNISGEMVDFSTVINSINEAISSVSSAASSSYGASGSGTVVVPLAVVEGAVEVGVVEPVDAGN